MTDVEIVVENRRGWDKGPTKRLGHETGREPKEKEERVIMSRDF